jgi:two-component system, OmpR family, sensor histidine kinase MtrB
VPHPSSRGNHITQRPSGEQGDQGEPARPKVPSLQTRLRLAVVGAALLFVLLAVALGSMTRFLGQDAKNLREAVESALVTKNIEIELTRHNIATGGHLRPDTADPAEIATTLRRNLVDARQYINTPDEGELVDEVEQRVNAYLAAHQEIREQGVTGRRAIEAPRPAFEAALASTQRLIDLNVEQASEFLSQATRWYRIAILFSVAAGMMVVLGLGGALLGFGRWVQQPLAAVASAIARFGAGDRASRAAEVGPAEVRQIADTFNGMATILARQERERIAFIGGVAHDLRGPVTAIQMATGMLDPDGPLRGVPSEQTLALLLRQTARLERMIGDFLDAVRIHGGHLEMKAEPVDLVGLVHESAEQVRPTALGHQLVVSIPSYPVMVTGDAMRLGQVLNNLLSNSVKYSPEGGAITISLEESPGAAILTVTDQGIGIQPAERDQIFEPFRRTVASRDLVPGVGLGLSISKRIVEAHGGSIEVASVPGRGSTFRVRIPRIAPAKDQPR